MSGECSFTAAILTRTFSTRTSRAAHSLHGGTQADAPRIECGQPDAAPSKSSIGLAEATERDANYCSLTKAQPVSSLSQYRASAMPGVHRFSSLQNQNMPQPQHRLRAGIPSPTAAVPSVGIMWCSTNGDRAFSELPDATNIFHWSQAFTAFSFSRTLGHSRLC